MPLPPDPDRADRKRKVKSKHANKGKVAENAVEAWLAERSSAELGFVYHRFPDARAARGAIAAQPSDYLVGCKRSLREPQTVFLEVKETEEEYRLPKSKITQYGKLLLWHLAGSQVIVLVHRKVHNDWVYFRNRELFAHNEPPTSFPFAGRPAFATAAEALQEIFK